MTRHGIQLPDTELAAFCRRWRVRKLSFFGSFLREDFGPESDIDVLVWFEPGWTPGLEIVTMEQELSGLLGGRKVDLATEDALYRRVKKRVLSEAEAVYVA
jgi:hypothetical protein